tara:strand:+ start:195 stop:566 length:372 start_codon:yes stop_codon:yes gene_type:complete
MAWTDLERRRDGLIGASASASGSYRENEVPYTFSGTATTEAKVSLPFQTEWFQVSATTSDAVKYSFENAGTGNTKHMVVAGNTSSPVIHAAVDEIYFLNDYSLIAKLSNIPSGSNSYSVDERA